MHDAIRLVVADDHLLFRQGLRALLAAEPDVAIVGEVERVEHLTELLARTPCDLVLLDLQMERDTVADIQALSRYAAIVVVTANESAPNAVRALRHGARAVVFKRFAVETLIEAIRAVALGGVWLPPSLHADLVTELRLTEANPLSPREEEIMHLVACGLRNAEIALELAISEQTVKTHLQRIFRKIGVRDRVGLVLYARAQHERV